MNAVSRLVSKEDVFKNGRLFASENVITLPVKILLKAVADFMQVMAVSNWEKLNTRTAVPMKGFLKEGIFEGSSILTDKNKAITFGMWVAGNLVFILPLSLAKAKAVEKAAYIKKYCAKGESAFGWMVTTSRGGGFYVVGIACSNDIITTIESIGTKPTKLQAV